MALHADAISENGSAGERRGRVYGENAYPAPVGASLTDEMVGQGGLARPGRARDPYNLIRPAARGKSESPDRPGRFPTAFQE
jgi:hypothetical protein